MKVKLEKNCLEMSKLDILIPVHNAFSFVKNCVQSILNANTQKLGRIILSDDYSTDGSLAEYLGNILDDKRIKLLHTEVRGYFSGNVNWASSYIESPYFIIMNSDTKVYSKDWLDVILEEYVRWEAEGEKVGIISPCIAAYENPCPVSRHLLGINQIGAVCWFIPFAVWKQLGGLREDGAYRHWNSDFDFCKKVIEAGYKIGKVPTYIQHWGGRSGKPKEVPRCLEEN